MQIYSVLDLTRYIKQVFDKDRTLGSVFVRGEISNFKRHSSGHCYFTLKDREAVLRSVMFRGRAQFLKFVPLDGMKVVAGGHITVFERDGQYQLYVEHLIPDGVGELNLAFAQLKEKLAAEGLFAEERKKMLPLLPRKVGIITSDTGAAIRDIITVAKRRHPGIILHLYPVAVQGPEAPGQIAHAIRSMNEYGEADVLIVGRGGGSLEELWAFNEEQVVRAIAESYLPIVSAVGHETDFTLADFAADKRAATPSQAAEIAVPDVQEMKRYLLALRAMLISHSTTKIKDSRRRLLQLRQSAVLQRPLELLASRQQTVDVLKERLRYAMEQQYRQKQYVFQLAGEKLAMLNPLGVLGRGYSIARTLDKQLITDPQALMQDQKIEVLVAKGGFYARVMDSKEAEAE